MAREKLTIENIRPGAREVHQVKWPGTEKEVGLLLLRCAEIQAAYFATREWFRKQDQPVDLLGSEEFNREIELQQCYLMILEPDSKLPKDRLFSSDKEAREKMSLDEVAYFQHEHSRLNDELIKDWKLEDLWKGEEQNS